MKRKVTVRMNTANAYQKYKEQDIEMASPVTLIVMLYNGCIKQLKLAKMALEKNDYEQTNVRLQKAQDIITELLNNLDFNYSVSNELMSIYDFMLREMVQINVTKQTEKIDPLVTMLTSLMEAWKQVAQQSHLPYGQLEGSGV